MFTFLDTCFSSFFENDALIKNTSKRKNKPLNTVSLQTHYLLGNERPPHLMGFFISFELCDGNFDLAF